MKKILAGLGIVGIAAAVAALALTVTGGIGGGKKAPSYYTVKQASTALTTYVNAKTMPQGAAVYATRCASFKKTTTSYAVDKTNTTGLYGCVVDIRTTANPTATAECDEVVFDYPPGAAAVSNIRGNTVDPTNCK